MKHSILAIAGLTVGLISTGCSRSMNENSSVKFDLSSLKGSNSSLSTEVDIDFIAINISGPGMNRIICTFDSPDGDQPPRWSGPCQSPPDSSIIEIPDIKTGNDRLVQVLVVKEERNVTTDQEQEYFNYGEARVALGPGDNDVPINLQENPVASNKDASAVGRFERANGSRYTGKVALQFTPPTGAAPMTIFNLEMFDGWMELYLLDNINLTYQLLDTGEVLFGGPVNQLSPQFEASGSVVKIVKPKTYDDDNGNIRQESERILSLGFWKGNGPDPSKAVCYDITAQDSQYAYVDAAASSDALSWPADFNITGGATCTLTDPLVTANLLQVGAEQMLEGGGPPTFYGPYKFFQTTDGNFSPIDAVTVAGGVELKWKYLPGVVGPGKRVGGTAVVVKPGQPEERFKRLNEGARGFDCNVLLQNGYSRIDALGGAESVVVNGADMSFFNDHHVVLCPFDSQREFYTSVLDLNDNGGSDNGGGGNAQTEATKIVISNWTQTPYPHINANTCTPMTLVLLDDNDNPGFIPNSPDGVYTVTLTTNEGSFYADATCSSPQSSFDFTGSNSENIFFNGSNTGALNLQAQTFNTETVTLTSASVASSIQPTAAVDRLELITRPDTHYSTECEVMPILVVDTDGVPTNNPAGAITLATTQTNAAPNFFAPGDCGGSPSNQFTLPANTPVGIVEFLAEDNDSVTIFSTNGLGITDFSETVTTVLTPPAEYARIEGPYATDGGNSCNEQFSIVSYYYDNATNRAVKAYPASNITFTLSHSADLSAGSFYQNDACATGLTGNQLTLATSMKEIHFNFETPESGPLTYELNADADIDDFDALNFEFQLD